MTFRCVPSYDASAQWVSLRLSLFNTEMFIKSEELFLKIFYRVKLCRSNNVFAGLEQLFLESHDYWVLYMKFLNFYMLIILIK